MLLSLGFKDNTVEDMDMLEKNHEAIRIDDGELREVKAAKILSRIQSYCTAIQEVPVSEIMVTQLLGNDKYTEIAWLALNRFTRDQDMVETLQYIAHALTEMIDEMNEEPG